MKLPLLVAAIAATMAAQPALSRSAATAGASGLRIVARIAGPDGHWDLASFDPVRRRIYVAHGDAVLAIDVDTGAVRADFAKGDRLHAVVDVPGTHLIVTTNAGDNTAKVNDSRNGALLASIPVARDPDSAVYDPGSGKVVVIGGDSGEITLVDPRRFKAVGSIAVGGALESAQPDGLGRLYVNAEDSNEIVVVDLKARKVVARYPLEGCRGPTGLALVAGGRLVSACVSGAVKILDAASGRDIATLAIGAGPDGVIYDARRSLAYVPSGLTGTLAVIALSGPKANTVIDAVATQKGARTGALDPKTGRIYLPVAQFAAPAAVGQRPAIKPGTFEVLVLGR